MMALHREKPVINTDAHTYIYTDNVILIFNLNDVYLHVQTSREYLHDHSRRFAHRRRPWRCIPHILQK